MNKNLSTVYRYLSDYGYSVFPLKENEKTPVRSWIEYQNTRLDPMEATDLWGENQNYNIGLVTGSISNITVVDIDVKDPNNQVSFEAFPTTYTVQTPSGGYHLYYVYNPDIGTSANQYPDLPHVDIRNNGGYVVAPPSKTEQGDYKVIKDVPIAMFPSHMFVKKKRAANHKGVSIINEFTELEEGGRNDALTTLANSLFKILPTNQWNTVAAVVSSANQKFSKPLNEKEVQTIVNSMSKRVSVNKLIDFDVDHKGKPFINAVNVFKIFEQDPDLKNIFRRNTVVDIVVKHTWVVLKR